MRRIAWACAFLVLSAQGKPAPCWCPASTRIPEVLAIGAFFSRSVRGRQRDPAGVPIAGALSEILLDRGRYQQATDVLTASRGCCRTAERCSPVRSGGRTRVPYFPP